MKALGQLSSPVSMPSGGMLESRWQAGIDLLTKYKQITTKVPASSVFTTQFLPKS
jgi:hypothetical protein